MDGETPRSFGRYRMVRRIGQGGMAEVYLGEVLGLGGFRKRVAIKRLLPHYAQNERFVTMLEDEARIAAAIRHPNVAEVLDFGSVDGQHFIAMEYIDGVDLATVLRGFRLRNMLLPLPAALYIARGVAEGLHAAHALKDSEGRPQEVIHRDVSPHNILISYEGQVKLIDFGVAKATNNSTKTRSGVIKGKLQYMSPEQAQAQDLDGRADIFSLGMTLYKMLTGRLPFTGQNEYQVYDQILRKQPIPPRQLMDEIPERVDAIVLKALRKNRERRFQTAQEMADLLDVALAEIDLDYGAHELGELLSGERPQPSTVENLYEEDFIASESGIDEPAEVDDRAIDRLTDVHSVIKPRPGEPAAIVEDDGHTSESEVGAIVASGQSGEPASPQPTVPTPAPSVVPEPPRPAVIRPVARAVPVAVPVSPPGDTGARPWDQSPLEPTVDGLGRTAAIEQVDAGREPLIDLLTDDQGDVTLPVGPDLVTLDDVSSDTTRTRIEPIEERPFPWALVAIAAVALLGTAILVASLVGGDDPPPDEDEPPAVLKIGTGLPTDVPPTPDEPDGG